MCDGVPLIGCHGVAETAERRSGCAARGGTLGGCDRAKMPAAAAGALTAFASP